MRQGQHSKRSRGRGGKRPSGHQHGTKRAIDSNGPTVKVRGTAMQVYEKYQTLAREAQRVGNRVAAENLMQHAEHYYRINAANGGARHGNNERPITPDRTSGPDDRRIPEPAEAAPATNSVPAPEGMAPASEAVAPASEAVAPESTATTATDGADSTDKPVRRRGRTSPRKAIAKDKGTKDGPES